MNPRELLPALALLSILAAVAAAEPSPPARLGVEVRGPLDAFNMSHCFYRGMNITLALNMANLLSPVSPPPWCPTWAPRDGSLTCSCGLLPATWWPNATWILTLPPNATWSTVLRATVPGSAALGTHGVGYACNCSWSGWCMDEKTTTVWETFAACATNTIIRGNETTTSVICYTTSTPSTTTTTTTVTTTLEERMAATGNITVLPRRVNQSLLGLDLNVSLVEVLVDYPLPGESSALVNLTAVLYNLGLGARAGNRTIVPTEKGMLLIHNLTVLVDGKPVITCRGYCAPAERIPVNMSNATLVPSAQGSARLVLEPPGRPTNQYRFNVSICYTEDVNGTARRTCLNDTLRVPLPFGWRKIIYVADDCSVLNEAWKIVPANETGVQVELAEDRVKPSLTARNHCIVAEAGACEPVRLDVYSNGILTASRTGRGSITWCPVEPGTYMATAVDYFNNTVTGAFNLTWTAGPPPTVRKSLLGLAAVLIALMAALYILAGGGWPLGGP